MKKLIIKNLIIICCLSIIPLIPLQVNANNYVKKALSPMLRKTFSISDTSLRSTVKIYTEKNIAPPLFGIMAIGYGNGASHTFPFLMEDKLSFERARGFFELMGFEGETTWSKKNVVFADLAEEVLSGVFATLVKVEKMTMSRTSYEDCLLEAYLLSLKMIGNMPYYLRSVAHENLEVGLQDNFFEILKLTVLTLKHVTEGIGKYYSVNTELEIASATHRISMISTKKYREELYEILLGLENLLIHTMTRVLTEEHQALYAKEAGEVFAGIKALAKSFSLDDVIGQLYRVKGHERHDKWRRKF